MTILLILAVALLGILLYLNYFQFVPVLLSSGDVFLMAFGGFLFVLPIAVGIWYFKEDKNHGKS